MNTAPLLLDLYLLAGIAIIAIGEQDAGMFLAAVAWPLVLGWLLVQGIRRRRP